MTREVVVNEPIDVLTRVMADGAIHPTSFLWRDRTRYVSSIGRSWEERIRGKTIRCYLIQTVEMNTYELHYDPEVHSWSIHRAWLHDAVA
jgi:hypothetical protein